MPLGASSAGAGRRHNTLTWYAPSSPQTAGSHADPARRIRLAVHMADLDIAAKPVLRLAECPSGRGCDMGWRAANESAAASQKLSLRCPAKQPCPDALSLSILESSESKTIAEGGLADYAARESLRILCADANGRMQRRRDKVPEWLLLHVNLCFFSSHGMLA